MSRMMIELVESELNEANECRCMSLKIICFMRSVSLPIQPRPQALRVSKSEQAKLR